MIETSVLSHSIDPEIARRRALSNVYSLLLKLAEENNQDNSDLEDITSQQEESIEPLKTITPLEASV